MKQRVLSGNRLYFLPSNIWKYPMTSLSLETSDWALRDWVITTCVCQYVQSAFLFSGRCPYSKWTWGPPTSSLLCRTHFSHTCLRCLPLLRSSTVSNSSVGRDFAGRQIFQVCIINSVFIFYRHVSFHSYDQTEERVITPSHCISNLKDLRKLCLYVPWVWKLGQQSWPWFLCPLVFPVLLVTFEGALPPSDNDSVAAEEDFPSWLLLRLGHTLYKLQYF